MGRRYFGGATECLSSTLKMSFNLRQTRAVETFITIMEMHFVEQNVEKRIERTHNTFARGEMTDNEYEAEYEKIAQDVDGAMLAGIKAASTPNVGYARSPALTEAASIVRYWRAQVSSNQNNVGLLRGIRGFELKHSLPT